MSDDTLHCAASKDCAYAYGMDCSICFVAPAPEPPADEALCAKQAFDAIAGFIFGVGEGFADDGERLFSIANAQAATSFLHKRVAHLEAAEKAHVDSMEAFQEDVSRQLRSREAALEAAESELTLQADVMCDLRDELAAVESRPRCESLESGDATCTVLARRLAQAEVCCEDAVSANARLRKALRIVASSLSVKPTSPTRARDVALAVLTEGETR